MPHAVFVHCMFVWIKPITLFDLSASVFQTDRKSKGKSERGCL